MSMFWFNSRPFATSRKKQTNNDDLIFPYRLVLYNVDQHHQQHTKTSIPSSSARIQHLDLSHIHTITSPLLLDPVLRQGEGTSLGRVKVRL